jgi:hypothetical protein
MIVCNPLLLASNLPFYELPATFPDCPIARAASRSKRLFS